MRTRYKPDLPKVTYHVMTRIAQQEHRFADHPEAKDYFLYLLDFYKNVFYVDLLAFTILDNHFHLCLTVNKPPVDSQDIQARYELSQEIVSRPRQFQPYMVDALYQRFTDLSAFMWIINWRMAMFHNRRAKTKGHFWGHRFKSKVVDNAKNLICVMTYIELNSVRARIVDRAETYQFSSIYRIANKLKEEDAQDQTPRVGFLKHLADGKRGRAYIQLTNYLGEVTAHKKQRKTYGLISTFASNFLSDTDLSKLVREIELGTPSHWRRDTYSQSLDDSARHEPMSRRSGTNAPMKA